MFYISSSFYVSSLPDTVGGGFTQEDIDWYSLFTSPATITDGFGNSRRLAGDLGVSRPRITWDNLLVANTLLADYEDVNFPAANLGNVSSAEKWKTAAGQEATEQYIHFSTEEYGGVDYLMLAGHNLGTLGVDYKLQSRAGVTNYHEIDLGGGVVGTDIAIDSINGNFQFIISVDGGADEVITATYVSETNVTYTDFIADINAQLTGCSIALNGGNLRITSDVAAPTGSIQIKTVSGVNHWATYINDYISMDASTGWSDVFAAQTAINDRAIIYQFSPLAGKYWRLVLTPPGGTTTPMSIAVLYIGRALVLPRGIYVGHTPINYGRKTKVITNRSESGQYLGRVTSNTFLQSGFQLSNIDPLFYRVWLEPFVQHAQTQPFGFAWYPSVYPDEAAYAWTLADIIPKNSRPNGMMEMSISLEALSP